jgi:uncharacterized Zn-finger protein
MIVFMYPQPLEFIHRRSHAGKGNSNKRISSFGVARIIISSPDALQKPQLSPSFRSWLDKFIESRLNQDESLDGFPDSFESMIPEEAQSAIHEEVSEEVTPDSVSQAPAFPSSITYEELSFFFELFYKHQDSAK